MLSAYKALTGRTGEETAREVGAILQEGAVRWVGLKKAAPPPVRCLRALFTPCNLLVCNAAWCISLTFFDSRHFFAMGISKINSLLFISFTRLPNISNTSLSLGAGALDSLCKHAVLAFGIGYLSEEKQKKRRRCEGYAFCVAVGIDQHAVGKVDLLEREHFFFTPNAFLKHPAAAFPTRGLALACPTAFVLPPSTLPIAFCEALPRAPRVRGLGCFLRLGWHDEAGLLWAPFQKNLDGLMRPPQLSAHLPKSTDAQRERTERWQEERCVPCLHGKAPQSASRV